MKKSLLIIFLLMIIAPICFISWLSYSSYAQEKESAAERYSILARRQLEEIDRLIQSHIQKVELELQAYRNVDEKDVVELRRISRTERTVGQLFIINTEDNFLFPPESGEMSEKEELFLAEAQALELPLVLGSRTADRKVDSSNERGWYTWFMADGINFIYWQTSDTGNRIGIMLDRITLLSGITAMLPDSDYTLSSEFLSRILLTDARGNSLYQWGLYAPADNELPIAEVGLSPPLASWHLYLFLDLTTDDTFPLLRQYASLFSGAAALILIMVLLAIYFYRENRKLISDALQKVSFVNQVSHELRTPLTNIRLYTEMLEARLTDAKDLEHIGVVLSESRRLSRMIGNVLTFSKEESSGFSVSPSEIVVDDIIQRVAESFTPSLSSKSIQVVLTRGAPAPIFTDPDFVEQILSNLIGNVEKYAAAGKYLEITSSQDDILTTITVRDRGPGIPARERKNVFKPFYRISNKLTDGVSGAGIGLAISRRLSGKLGGRLFLEDAGPGAVFHLILNNSIEGDEK